MKNWKSIIQHPQFRYMDHIQKSSFLDYPYTAMTSFAIDDVLTITVSDQLSPPTMRLWVHPKTVVLGVPDTRLPYIHEGVKLLSNQGYHVIVRNSGGLAVALDIGVLNLSMILPHAKKTSIHACYETMLQFIKYMLRDYTNNIKAYEIIGSYCPGDYDLSINGVKFAGISQRRIKDGAAIQIYLDIEGDSKERATLIQSFYDQSLKNEEIKFNYPVVKHEKMGSLSQLLGKRITVEEIIDCAYRSLMNLTGEIVMPAFSDKELRTFEKRFKQIEKRNENIAHMQ